MQSWLKISIILCGFGFFKEMRPSEPSFTNFVTGPWRNFTAEEVNKELFPVGSYSYLLMLVVVFFITDLCRYKTLITICGVSGLIVAGLVLWSKTIFMFEIMEVVYGIFMSTEVAYYTYIYAKVDKEHYQMVTSHTRAAIQAGRGTSSLLGQLLISFELMDYHQLNYISFSSLILAALWSLLLPSVKKSIYFHQTESEETICKKSKMAFSLMRDHFSNSYTHSYLVKWSIVFALSTCGFMFVQTYIQLLWGEIVGGADKLPYNGLIETGITAASFLMAILVGYLKVDWKNYGELLVTLCCLTEGSVLILSSQTNLVGISYASYIIFGGVFTFMVTVASVEIASHLSEDSYGLIFGFNTFVGIALLSIFTAVFVTEGGFEFSIRQQFLTCGIYHIVISVPYAILGLYKYCEKSSSETSKSDEETNCDKNEEKAVRF